MRWWYNGDVEADKPLVLKGRPEKERFESLVVKGDDCWLWQGSINRTGYGYFSRKGRSALAHRVAYELYKGPIPEGAQVDHQCHNRDETCRGGWGCPHRRCVNPDHLELATQSENLQRSGRCGDRVRERAAKITHCPRGHIKVPGKRWCPGCVSERARAASLKGQGLRDPRRMDDAKVQAVRDLLAQGKSHSQIAAATGVSISTVSRIRNGGSWYAKP